MAIAHESKLGISEHNHETFAEDWEDTDNGRQPRHNNFNTELSWNKDVAASNSDELLLKDKALLDDIAFLDEMATVLDLITLSSVGYGVSTKDPAAACEGYGYAQYEKGELKGGTACSNSTFCCYSDEPEYDDFNDICGNFTGIICHGSKTNPNCKGDFACVDANIGLVKDGSCVGSYSCEAVHSALGSIEEGSCIGNAACRNINRHAVSNDITIKGQSCVGNSACRWAAILSDGRGIQGQSCIGDDSCYGARINGQIRDQSCRGKTACAWLWAKHVNDLSCIGKMSCSNANVTGNITNNSCQGSYLCNRVISDIDLVYYEGPTSSPTTLSSETYNIPMILLVVIAMILLVVIVGGSLSFFL
eukprot:CAMPEP_0194140738 /NCGR_PEP_ID=MMETSP0152-20130528/10252_1 /TAXON_ID=1049557 /ORGANISM="Thalassiothrix antarctica, Strain L6-D1" /LENGTH=361 /DNA_ID=CAMNT_0038839111 /DNA_START=50 /DNA_END=1135 /DNA_ORIENTATION=-